MPIRASLCPGSSYSFESVLAFEALEALLCLPEIGLVGITNNSPKGFDPGIVALNSYIDLA